MPEPKPKVVLVCDDEPYILEVVGHVVRACFKSGDPYELHKAEDGQEALQKARALKPDLILLDIMMPKMSGFEVCRALKDDDSTKHIRIILLTAMGQERDQNVGKECGADDYETKPFSPRRLLEKLKLLLS